MMGFTVYCRLLASARAGPAPHPADAAAWERAPDSSIERRGDFSDASGSGAYANACGSGTAVISYNQRMHQYQVVLCSALN
jgi:hypothetical protein